MNIIDLSALPEPDVIDVISYEEILQEYIKGFRKIKPEYIDITESDPAYMVMEMAAYREVILRQRINEAALAVMLATSTGTDLDNLGGLFNLTRLVINPGDKITIPPTPLIMEKDAHFKERILLANESKNTAGSEDDYLYHTLKADGRIKAAAAYSVPGSLIVEIFLLSNEPGGIPSQDLINIVDKALNKKTVRPLSDQVQVKAAIINNFNVIAELTLFDGAGEAEVLAAARAGLDAYLDKFAKLGQDLTLDGFYCALRVDGVYKVKLIEPTADINNSYSSVGRADTITLTAVAK